MRRWRGSTEIVAIEELESAYPFFGTFRAQSGGGGFYEVEIRSLEGFANSCGCVDHRVNGLGTCKHIEGVLAALRRRSARAFREAAARGIPRIEIFVDRLGTSVPPDPAVYARRMGCEDQAAFTRMLLRERCYATRRSHASPAVR